MQAASEVRGDRGEVKLLNIALLNPELCKRIFHLKIIETIKIHCYLISIRGQSCFAHSILTLTPFSEKVSCSVDFSMACHRPM